MLQGRTSGTGDPFNFGEATVSRAAVALQGAKGPDYADGTGPVGFGYVLGRSPAKARLAAIVDALGQTMTYGERIAAALEATVGRRVAGERAARDAEVAATRVEFFTMQRGED